MTGVLYIAFVIIGNRASCGKVPETESGWGESEATLVPGASAGENTSKRRD
jgi:hypothetical protein